MVIERRSRKAITLVSNRKQGKPKKGVPNGQKAQPLHTKTAKPKSSRAIAALILQKIIQQQGSLTSLFPEYLDQLSPSESGLIKDLCYGSCRWFYRLEAILKQLLAKPLKTKDSDIHALLIIGLYQLAFTQMPDHAVLNETVKATKPLKKDWAKNLVNGVLRQYLRDHDNLDNNALDKSPTAHPKWFVERIESAYPDHAKDILDANNQHPPMTCRVNRVQTSREEYLKILNDNGISAKGGEHGADSLYLDSAISATLLPKFAEGWVSIQDESPQLAAELLDLKSGQRVLDACAAPGGKTCHIAETQPDIHYLLALDIEQRRLPRIEDNLARLQLQADVVCGDASQPLDWWDGKAFDRILIDAPCSATGIIRRQSDIKLLRQSSHIDELSKLQMRILKALWALLAPQGKLVYATCSIMPNENSDIIAKFLAQQNNAKELVINAPWGIPQTHGRQILPTNGGPDGFYYACLQKMA